jgi:hypothetical protein
VSHEHQIRAKPLAILDTLITCALVAWFIAAAGDRYVGYWGLLICAGYSALTVWHYFPQGVSVGISELASFYVSISYLDILTGRVPHDRVHPSIGHEHECPTCSHTPDIYRIHGVLDLIGYTLIAISMIATTLPLKASALFFGPLMYIGFAFRLSDYTQLSMDARKRYRSSFKSFGIVLAVTGLVLFAGKVFLYSYWNALAAWWAQQPILLEFGPVIRPAAFLPFHITGVLGSALLLASVHLVDSVTHDLDDRGLPPQQLARKLRSIAVLGRIRTVLSVYTWICFVWLFLPWLRRIHFPPVSLELFPRS